MPTVNAISTERWQEAQKVEALFWQTVAKRPEKLQRDIADGHHFTAGMLDIRPDTVGESVLDLAGGDYPLSDELINWPQSPVRSYTVVDPAPPTQRPYGVERVQEMAETYRGELVDEVWGYNALQHVQDPAAVMATARRHARHVIRWFDVVETPIETHHPHSITAAWLRAQLSMDGFHLVRDIEGTRFVDSHRQKFVALVAERSHTP